MLRVMMPKQSIKYLLNAVPEVLAPGRLQCVHITVTELHKIQHSYVINRVVKARSTSEVTARGPDGLSP